ncbi:hypothetical protein H4S08_003674 [Coemansia sp. RSA 1365]|nr:hypothetical protein H4S08_003674 [Coemansia sp. RSA 1365]
MLTSGMTAVSLNLSEKRKSLILAGLDPSAVMDICSRALSFWSYQMALEFAYQEAAAGARNKRMQSAETHALSRITDTNKRLKGKRVC